MLYYSWHCLHLIGALLVSIGDGSVHHQLLWAFQFPGHACRKSREALGTRRNVKGEEVGNFCVKGGRVGGAPLPFIPQKQAIFGCFLGSAEWRPFFDCSQLGSG